ncbi:AAA family ATPase [Chitinophaga qingshengii]|uniref:Tunicamycin resistance protein n=1 Tax=Chitinophaga qingshengii TaxID=1569794 RepID=A0ABR7TXR0_9BACT|nr:AAA family ATPase [Chitinophaga qingshengii]MBC9934453.1 tunicamycin resistance protein [Chitinophaga qingshengii]
MIIWINGAFGVGKTHTSYELCRRIDNSFLFDPEQVGFFLRKNLPQTAQYDDFQQMPLWRRQVLENLLYCEDTNAVTIVPMTLVDDEIFDFIIGGLKQQGADVRHFSLMAGKQTIEKRLARRGDKNAWNYKQVDRCLTSLVKPKYQLHIDTEQYTLDEVVEAIADNIHLPLSKGRLNGLLKRINWLKTTLKNIR